MLAVPAAPCQPRLDVLRLILDESIEHLARRLPVIEPILEDRSEDEIRLGRHRGGVLGRKRPRVHVETDHRGDDPGGLFEVVAAHHRPGGEDGEHVCVERRASFLIRRAGRFFQIAGRQSFPKHFKVFTSVGCSADPKLELGEPPPQVVVLGISTNRRLERVVGAGHVVAGGVGRLGTGEHELCELGERLVIVRPEADVAAVKSDRLGRLALLEPLLRLTGQVACVSMDLESPQKKKTGNTNHQGGEENQQKLQVDPFHGIGDSGSVDGGMGTGETGRMSSLTAAGG